MSHTARGLPMARAIASTVSAVCAPSAASAATAFASRSWTIDLVAVAKQPPGDVAAHAPRADQAELHQDASFTVMSETSEIIAFVMSASSRCRPGRACAARSRSPSRSPS
jgi:hypothetical protein